MEDSSSPSSPPPDHDVASRHFRKDRARLRRRRSPLRLIRAYIYDVGALLKEAQAPLIGFAVLTCINTLFLTLWYQHPQCLEFAHGHPQACLSFRRALFETIRMYVFEVNLDWPEDDTLGQIMFFLTPMLGVALVFQGILDFGRYLLDKGSRRVAWQVSLAKTFHNHIIVCGLGRVSYRVMIQLLETGHEVVVVEQDWNSEFVPETLKLNVPVVLGDARDPDVLRQAGIQHARGIIAGTSDDLINIEIALEARRRSAKVHVVLRIFNDELDTNLERSFGSNSAFSSSALAAPSLAVAAVSSNIAFVLPLSDVVLGISKVVIAPNSQLTGFAQSIEEAHHVRLLQWLGSDGTWNWPKPGLRLEGGDRVLLMGTIEALEEAHRLNGHSSKFDFLGADRPQRPTPQFNTVIVCGLGKVGYRVVKELYRRVPRPEIVVVCGEDTKGPLIEELETAHIRFVRGDGRIPDILSQAGIAHAYSIAAVTSNNLVNIQIGLTARRMRPDVDVVLRVFSEALAEQLDHIFGAYTAFSTSALAAPTLAAAAVESGVSYALNIGGRLISTLEVPVQPNDEFHGKTIEQVYAESKMLVIALRRGRARTLMPAPATILAVGDMVELLADIGLLARLRPRVPQQDAYRTERLFAPRTVRLD